MKFKVGDIVRGKNKHYGYTNDKMTKGRVETVNVNGSIIGVRILEHPTYNGDTVFSVAACDFELVKPETIVIYQKNETVVAKNTATGEKAVAKCHPDDEFDFKTGATVAFDRLMGREVEKPKFVEKFEEGKTYVFDKEMLAIIHPDYKDNYDYWMNKCDGKVVTVTGELGRIEDYAISPRWCREVEEPKSYNGKVVCVDRGCNSGSLTVGKIYEFIDGYLIDDIGNKRPALHEPIKELYEFNSYTATKFIEVVE